MKNRFRMRTAYISGMLAALMLTGAMPIQGTVLYAETLGEEESNVIYEYKNGVLHISGEGTVTQNGAFSGDDSINFTEVTSVIMDEGITAIEAGAFQNCTNLKEVQFPTTLTEIGQSAFFRCTALQSVTLPEGLKTLSYMAFGFCFHLQSVDLPNTLESIGDQCFMYCTELSDIEIPNSVTEIGKEIFDFDAAWYEAQTEDFVILADHYLYWYQGEESVVEIPDGVTVIGSQAFTTCEISNAVFLGEEIREATLSPREDITELIFPDTVTAVKSGAASELPFLSSVRLSDNLVFIGMGAFIGCTSLTDIQLPNTLKQIETNAFKECTALTDLTLPDGLEYIGEEAFSGCTALDDVLIPDSVTELGLSAFANTAWVSNAGDFVLCENGLLYLYQGKDKVIDIPEGTRRLLSNALKLSTAVELRFPDSLRQIDSNAVSGTSLLEIRLNDGLETIAENALRSCNSLTSIAIPASVTETSDYAIESETLETVIGTAGSAAQTYAEHNGYSFVTEAELPPAGEDMRIVYGKDTWSFGNTSTALGSSYSMTPEARAQLEALGVSGSKIDKEWGGSCFGLSLTVILAKNGLLPFADDLYTVEPDDSVTSIIHYYHWIQNTTAVVNYVADQKETPAQQFYHMLKMAERVQYGESPFVMAFATASSSHAVVGYGLESGEWEFDGKVYDGRILVWDPNFPTAQKEETQFYYDTHSYDYCIPYYGVHYADGESDNVGRLNLVCNDLSVLNAAPYPFADTAQVGDVNCDGEISIADAVLLSRLVAEDQTADITAAGRSNADCNADHELTVEDTVLLLQMLAGLLV